MGLVGKPAGPLVRKETNHVNVIIQALTDQHAVTSFLLDGKLDVQRFKSACQDLIHLIAWRDTRGVPNALRALERDAEWEPSPEELCERLRPSDFGLWREVVRWAGYLAVKNRLEANLATDIRLLETTICMVEVTGHQVVALIPANKFGRAPVSLHLSVSVQLSDHQEESVVWLELAKAENLTLREACPEDPDGLPRKGCRYDV